MTLIHTLKSVQEDFRLRHLIFKIGKMLQLKPSKSLRRSKIPKSSFLAIKIINMLLMCREVKTLNASKKMIIWIKTEIQIMTRSRNPRLMWAKIQKSNKAHLKSLKRREILRSRKRLKRAKCIILNGIARWISNQITTSARSSIRVRKGIL